MNPLDRHELETSLRVSGTSNPSSSSVSKLTFISILKNSSLCHGELKDPTKNVPAYDS